VKAVQYWVSPDGKPISIGFPVRQGLWTMKDQIVSGVNPPPSGKVAKIDSLANGPYYSMAKDTETETG
jgi:hypothetical protein